uniref:C962R-like N-terminal AEP domain-containing protein n=1 Tax=viral metagenome TaxID=1070528 RepID=A0A6C0IXH5_9ZZZZ
MNAMSSFRCKVSTSKWKFTQKDKDENVKLRTHNLMDGGELSVPDNEYERFLRVCAESICDGEKLFIVEQRSHPLYKIFFDFDVFMYDVIDRNELYTNICKLVVSTLNELFDDTVDSFELICSVTDVKQARKNQKKCYKYGIHLICPTLIVNKEKMLRVREAVVQKIQNNLEKHGPTHWDDDIDKVVYESNGFRMNYSRKGSKCKCSQKQRDLCDKCGGSGKIDEGRPYVPLLTIMNDYSHTTHENNMDFDTVYEILNKTSIRVSSQSDTVEFNKSPPSWFEDSSLFDVPDGLITQAPKRKLSEGLDSVESKLQNKKDLSLSELDTLNTWFRTVCNKKKLPKQYKGVTLSSAFTFTNNNVRSNIIARVDSQFCINIGREHATNTVYLLVNTLTKKAVMKCYCRCDTTEGRRTIVKGKRQMCKDFSSHDIDTSDLQLQIGCGVVSRQINPRILAMF